MGGGDGRAAAVSAWTVEGNDPINGGAEEAAGSLHTGGAHFAMGDGSVRFLSENMDMKTYQGISTRAGGETLGDF